MAPRWRSFSAALLPSYFSGAYADVPFGRSPTWGQVLDVSPALRVSRAPRRPSLERRLDVTHALLHLPLHHHFYQWLGQAQDSLRVGIDRSDQTGPALASAEVEGRIPGKDLCLALAAEVVGARVLLDLIFHASNAVVLTLEPRPHRDRARVRLSDVVGDAIPLVFVAEIGHVVEDLSHGPVYLQFDADHETSSCFTQPVWDNVYFISLCMT